MAGRHGLWSGHPSTRQRAIALAVQTLESIPPGAFLAGFA